MLNTENEIDLYDDAINPLDGVEEIMCNNDWSFDRQAEDQMSVHVSGKFGHYKMSFVWQEDYCAVQCYCEPDLSIHRHNEKPALKILNQINKDLWLGHFDIREDKSNKAHKAPCFRHTSLFRDMSHNSGIAHMEDIIDIAIHECERFHTCFSLLSQSTPVCAKDYSFALSDVAGLS